MMISTRGRYALRVLVDLAEHSGSLVPMKDVAARQGISKKYMEQIMALLVKDGYVEGVHGKGGGYRLGRPPEQCVVGDILRLTEGSLAPVACLSCDEPCERADSCRTVGMWRRFEEITNEYFDGITVKDLMKTEYRQPRPERARLFALHMKKAPARLGESLYFYSVVRA